MAITVRIANSLRHIQTKAPTPISTVARVIDVNKINRVVAVTFPITNQALLGTDFERLIKNCPKIEKIDFSGCLLSPNLLKAYADVLKKNPNNVQVLSFRYNSGFSSDALKYFLQLPGLKKLEWPTFLKIESGTRALFPNVEIVENPSKPTEWL